MSELRTPPSLKWLLDKRARILGEIDRLKGDLPTMRQRLEKQIARTEDLLASIIDPAFKH
ncbi:MAG: hypothetical protein MO853_14315 [Candidatus Protistobacter heckmanni]|nr:hypothetical protein [Candidatus Protistobacter heckmanni]MCS6764888.1 hypothetical protein [Candidatus Protistobacter heckmanni]